MIAGERKRSPAGKLIVILGPTAVGKTALSVGLAKKLDTEIVSGDSMLVYRGFDIGSAKPTMEERQGIAHHMVDILEPAQEFSVTEFQRLAAEAIAGIQAKGKIPILAGGTGLYVKSLLEGYRFNGAAEDRAYRESLERIAAEQGKEAVHAMLASVDPASAARLHVHDFRRVVRALEVATHSAEHISQSRLLDSDGHLAYDACVIGLSMDRMHLYERINARAEQMMAAGLIEEVRTLLASGVPRSTQAMKGIGYKETAAYLAGEISLEEAISSIQKSTRHFAKRQITWYRKMPYIHWVDVDGLTGGEVLAKAAGIVAGFFAGL